MSRSLVVCCTMLALLVCASAVCIAADPPASDPFTVATDPDTGKTVITLPAHDGCVQCPDIARALARAGRFDDSVLNSLPAGQINLNEERARLVVIALDLALPSGVHVTVRRREGAAEPALELTIDEARLQRRARRIQRDLRQRAAKEADDYGLKLADGWQRCDPARPIVVLIHGYNSTCTSLEGLHQEIAAREFPCATFEYPNDGPLDESALLLSKELRRFLQQFPGRHISIVAHSMGGLVARAAIEDPELDPANVSQLVMVGTPNQGSQLALFPGGLECCDHLKNRRDDGLDGLLRSSVADGLNEAKSDLEPGSEFLKRLNSRERNPRVRYALLIGTGGPLSKAALAELQADIALATRQNSLAKLIAPRLQEPLSDLAELQRGAGDGAVAVSRARLDGVEDTELLPFEHFTISGNPEEQRVRELRAAILKRLESPN